MKLDYISMHPAPLKDDTPSTGAVILGAFVTAAALYAVTLFLFTL